MCGVVGIIGSPYSAQEAYQGLLLMQHRGQDAAGILSLESKNNNYHLHKDQGLVDTVFNKDNLYQLRGEIAIGHTRYSTIGVSELKDVQPQMINYPYGIGLAHNGNLVNIQELKENLKNEKNRYIYSDNDAETLLNIIAGELADSEKEENFSVKDMARAVSKVYSSAKGGYSVIGTIAKKGFFAFRDPNGIRPLIFGKRDLTEEEKDKSSFKESYCFASESNTMNYLDYDIIRDVRAGEFIFIDFEGNVHSEQLSQKKHTPCMFEWVYFANPDSVLDEENVYASRHRMGEFLGKKVKELVNEGFISPDVVVPVPETSRISSISLSETSGVPCRELLIKNRYIQRSFILNTQKSRERAVKLKLSPVAQEIKGKNVLLVDDSVVRGTTSKRIIEMVKKAGAKDVYFASACPPILNPCFYGIDFPHKEELLAYQKSLKEIEHILGADKVIYMSIEELKAALKKKNACMACLDGNYPVDVSAGQEFNQSRNSKGASANGDIHARAY
ncbi:MAG: amidophosphoribosyltransferase [Bacteriovoracaceae bacterium]